MTICHGQVRRSKNIQIVKSLSPGPFFKKNLGDSKKSKDLTLKDITLVHVFFEDPLEPFYFTPHT